MASLNLRAIAPSKVARGERGEALLEFAYASVVFFTTIFGILFFGQAIWRYNLVSNLAQEGARYAAVHGQQSGSPVSTADVSSFVAGRAVGLTVTVTTPLGAPSTIARGNPVSVLVSHSLALGGGLLPNWNFTIQSTGRMIMLR